MRTFDYIKASEKLLTPEIVQMIGSIHEHKGKQELFIEDNIDDLKTLLETALIQSTGVSNRIEDIFTSDSRLEELVKQKPKPHNRSKQEIAGYREVLTTIHENYEYIIPRPNVILSRFPHFRQQMLWKNYVPNFGMHGSLTKWTNLSLFQCLYSIFYAFTHSMTVMAV